MKIMPKIYDTVVFNDMPDAAVFRVVDTGVFCVGVIDATIDEKQQVQWIDISVAKRATRAQLKNAGLI